MEQAPNSVVAGPQVTQTVPIEIQRKTWTWRTPDILDEVTRDTADWGTKRDLYSPDFDGWKVRFQLPLANTSEDFGLYLLPVKDQHDIQKAEQYVRTPKYCAEFVIYYSGQELVRWSYRDKQFGNFGNTAQPGWGWASVFKAEQLQTIFQNLSSEKRSRFFSIKVTIWPEAAQAGWIQESPFPFESHQRMLFGLLDKKETADAQFRFVDGSSVYAIKSLLEAKCEYFASMFNQVNNFAEGDSNGTSMFQSSSELLEDDSDVEEEETPRVRANLPVKVETAEHQVAESASSTAASTQRTVNISDFGNRTYLALCSYLYTDSISFAPLKSKYEQDMSTKAIEDRISRREYNAQNAVTIGGFGQTQEHILPICVSPKTIYRLSDKLGLDELKQIAKDQISRSLTVDNALQEGCAEFCNLFPDMRTVHLRFMIRHWESIKAAPNFSEVWQKNLSSAIWVQIMQASMLKELS